MPRCLILSGVRRFNAKYEQESPESGANGGMLHGLGNSNTLFPSIGKSVLPPLAPRGAHPCTVDGKRCGLAGVTAAAEGSRSARCLKSNPCGDCRNLRKGSRISGGVAGGPGRSAGILVRWPEIAGRIPEFLEALPEVREGPQGFWKGSRGRRNLSRIPAEGVGEPETRRKYWMQETPLSQSIQELWMVASS